MKSTLAGTQADREVGAAIPGAPPLAADVFPGDAAESTEKVGACADATPWPMGWVIALAGIGCLLCARLLIPTPRVPTHAPETVNEISDRASGSTAAHFWKPRVP